MVNPIKFNAFTLIELMVVVAIIGVLAAVAYPSYLNHIMVSKRATAIQNILECAARLERRFTLNSTYTSDACDDLGNDDYSINVRVTGLSRTNRDCASNNKENCFLITATTIISNDEDCKSMSYNELGVKFGYDSRNVDNTVVCWRST